MKKHTLNIGKKKIDHYQFQKSLILVYQLFELLFYFRFVEHRDINSH